MQMKTANQNAVAKNATITDWLGMDVTRVADNRARTIKVTMIVATDAAAIAGPMPRDRSRTPTHSQ